MARPVVFLSHVGAHEDFWSPLKNVIETLFDVQVLVAEKQIGRFGGDAKQMMMELVKQADLGLFVYSSENKNIDFELSYWIENKQNGKGTARVLKGISHNPVPVDKYQLTTIYFPPDQPWRKLNEILLNVRDFINNWRTYAGPVWRQELEILRTRYQNIISATSELGTRFELVTNYLTRIARIGPAYDPRNWEFHINWEAPRGTTNDSYSGKTTCLLLLDRLLSKCALELDTRPDVLAAPFEALATLAKEHPTEAPQKVAASRVFEQVPQGVVELLQLPDLLGATSYEMRDSRTLRVLRDNQEKILFHAGPYYTPSKDAVFSSQAIQAAEYNIMLEAGALTKHVVGSTYQMVLSHAIQPSCPSSQIGIVITAADTNKERLALHSDTPFVVSDVSSRRFIWYGQKDRRPSTEFEAHEAFYQKLSRDGQLEKYTAIVHAHPVLLLERLTDNYAVRSIVIKNSRAHNNLVGARLAILPADPDPRMSEFGISLANQLYDGQFCGVCIPTHGIWVATDSLESCIERLRAFQADGVAE